MQTILLFGTGFIANNFIDMIQSQYPAYRLVVLYHHHKLYHNRGVQCYSMEDDIKAVLIKEEPQYIICLHGSSFVAANTDVIDSIEVNALKTMRFLDIIHSHKLYTNLEKVLVIGSASEYGKMYNQSIKEDFDLLPTSVYGLSKITLYNGAMYYKKRGLPITYIRQFNTIGVGQRKDFVLPSFCNELIRIEKQQQEASINVGDLTQERDFIDVRDTCNAYILLLRKGKIGEVYNVGSGEFITIQTLLDTVIKYSKVDKAQLQIHSNRQLFSKEESLCKRLHADISKLKSLGFKLKYSLDDTVEETLNYWRKNV